MLYYTILYYTILCYRVFLSALGREWGKFPAEADGALRYITRYCNITYYAILSYYCYMYIYI